MQHVDITTVISGEGFLATLSRDGRDALLRRFEKYCLRSEGCWNWLGRPHSRGYGRLYVGGRALFAHRISYLLFVGPIPPGLHIDHLCRNRLCVNPAHLEPVTCAENIRRGEPGKARRELTHCKHGHAFDEANTYRRRNGGRGCKACMKASLGAFYARRRAS